MPNRSITKPCHNCRRRRLRCDRSWPTCHKCAVSGQECLGYGKVFVWTQAIDGNGSSQPSAASAASGRRPGESAAQSGNFPYFDLDGGSAVACAVQDAVNRASSPHQRHHHHHGFGGEHQIGGSDDGPEQDQQLRGDASGRQSSLGPAAKDDLDAQDATREVLLGQLTDPVFQDLDRTSRGYLAHFADHVCKDLVARDSPDGNPFRELIPLTNKHPLLLQILIATSAMHWSNIFRGATGIPTGLTDPGGYLAQLRSRDLVSRQALIDALTAKQKAMGHLRQVLDTLDPAGSEVALAAMHFFIKFDLIDLERREEKGWRTHLEGASSILALISPDSNRYAASRMLRDCVIADCFIYHILGSTLASGALAARIARYAFDLLPVMKRVEVNSYLSCPPEILQVILVASQLSYETPCTDWTLSAADKALALIDQALAFDIPAWADQLRRTSNPDDMESRVHVASAHRSAACLYILQALPLARAVRPVDTDVLVDDILGHLAHLQEADVYFKATSWPTFIAGAETRDAEKRTWAMTRLFAIWNICSWGYIFTAIEMLKATWQMQDTASARSTSEQGMSGSSSVNWLQGLRDMGFDNLIV